MHSLDASDQSGFNQQEIDALIEQAGQQPAPAPSSPLSDAEVSAILEEASKQPRPQPDSVQRGQGQ